LELEAGLDKTRLDWVERQWNGAPEGVPHGLPRSPAAPADRGPIRRGAPKGIAKEPDSPKRSRRTPARARTLNPRFNAPFDC